MGLTPTATAIILCLASAWLIQFLFSYLQMRRFYSRINKLHRDGSVWIGMAGSAWRRRQYAVLVVDKNDKVVHVEQLSGWTVLATLKPVPGVDGITLADITDDGVQLPVNKKLLLAMRNAVKHIQDAREKAAARAELQAATEDGVVDNSSPDQAN
jgi:DNA-binding transcriptional regulator of glucitol operon